MSASSVEGASDSSDRLSELSWFLIAIAIMIQTARVFGMTAPHGELPFLSANDRSRWCAIAALTEDGAWEIDRFIEILDSKGKSKIWNTIDMVRHRGRDGKEHYYSSKPPLLTVIYAAICKPVTWVFGKKLTEEPFLIGRTVMFIANVIPLALWWIAVQWWLQRNVVDAWARFMILLIALFGTFLTTFAATLNNHIHGAICFSISLAIVWRIAIDARTERASPWWLWITAGFAASLTVACELPALAWAAAAGVPLMFIDWRKFAFGYVVSGLLVGVAFIAANVWSNGDLRPPYSHRGLGPLITTIPSAGAELPTKEQIISAVDPKTYSFTEQAELRPARLDGVTQLVDDTTLQRIAIKQRETDWGLYEWDDWYDYPKSYWLPDNKKGVDRGEANRWSYLLHITIGHHGIFSLTPIWIAGLVGCALWIRTERSSGSSVYQWLISESGIACSLAAVTAICIVFYVSRDVVDRNYAGVCSGFRWLFWLIPAWLWFSVPAISYCSRSSLGRAVIYIAVLVSVLSATLPWPNPWTHPWPYRLLLWMYPETYS